MPRKKKEDAPPAEANKPRSRRTKKAVGEPEPVADAPITEVEATKPRSRRTKKAVAEPEPVAVAPVLEVPPVAASSRPAPQSACPTYEPQGFPEAERAFVALTLHRQRRELERDEREVRAEADGHGRAPAPILLALVFEHVDCALGTLLQGGDAEEARRHIEKAHGRLRQLVEKARAHDPLASAWLVPADAMYVLFFPLVLGEVERARASVSEVTGFPFARHGYARDALLLELLAALLKDVWLEERAALLRDRLQGDASEEAGMVRLQLEILEALARTDARAFEKAIASLLGRANAYEVARNDASLRQYLSIPASAYVNFARARGMDVSISHPHIIAPLSWDHSRTSSNSARSR